MCCVGWQQGRGDKERQAACQVVEHGFHYFHRYLMKVLATVTAKVVTSCKLTWLDMK